MIRVRSTARTAALLGVIVVLVAAAAVGAFVVTDHARGRPAAQRTGSPSAPGVAVAATVAPAASGAGSGSSQPSVPPVPPATRAGVLSALRTLADAPGLGGRLRADVIDVDSGAVLYSRAPAVPAAPASTAKLLTASAILLVRPPTARFATEVVAGPRNSVVLVGGGDPTLSAAVGNKPTTYPGAARISDLAAQVRSSLPQSARISRIYVDDSLFAGPSVSPAWAPEDVPSSYGAAITAAMVDGGRSAPTDVNRSAHPDLDAGHALAQALGRGSIPVALGRAPSDAQVLGSVESAPISTLVEQMLQESDNVIAEVLGRQVALARHAAPSFAGAAAAIRSVLTGIGVDPGSGMRDASGLAATDRLSPRSLARLLTVIGSGRRASLAGVAAALPVAGWSGTLAARYGIGPASGGRGVVRAKTGTLSGLSTLAGLVRDKSGRLLAFALVADRTSSVNSAEAALDVLAARLGRCGCN